MTTSTSHPRPAGSVAIVGLGAVSPHGHGAEALWKGCLTGTQTAGPIRAFDADEHRVRFACEVPQDGPRLPRRLERQTDPFARMALQAAEEALRHAGLLSTPGPEDDGLKLPLKDVDPDRVATVVASGVGGITEMLTQQERLASGGPDRVRPYFSIAMPINMAAGQIAIRHGLGGPARGVVSACASGADAIGSAFDLIRAGRADVAVAGGSEAAINALAIAGFDAAGAMSRRNDDPTAASRPFDVDRDGFVAGEGAGILVLESAAHAEARGASPIAWLSGYGATDDAYDPTKPAVGGLGAARAMRLALADASLSTSDVGHVNAHGTSTPLNDAAEAQAIREVFGRADVAVTSIKSTIGHLLGAAGAVEAVVAALTLHHAQIPPTANLQRQDPECPVEVVTVRTSTDTSAILSSSFGFGGHNAVLALTADPR